MNKHIRLLVIIGLVVVTTGCLGGGSASVTYEGQKFADASMSTAEIGYRGTVANTGDAPAKDVRITLSAELQNGEVYDGTALLGTLEPGESEQYEASLVVDDDGMDKNWDNADWKYIVTYNDEREVVDVNS